MQYAVCSMQYAVCTNPFLVFLFTLFRVPYVKPPPNVAPTICTW